MAKYGNGHIALTGISCRFDHGTSTALVGANGSGKTTLLRLMCGLAQPIGREDQPRSVGQKTSGLSGTAAWTTSDGCR